MQNISKPIFFCFSMFVWFDCWGRESTSGRGQMHFEFVVRETQNGKYLTSVCILFWINTIFSEIHIIQITDNTFVQTWLEFANFGISLHSPMWCVLFCKILRLTWNFSLLFWLDLVGCGLGNLTTFRHPWTAVSFIKAWLHPIKANGGSHPNHLDSILCKLFGANGRQNIKMQTA